MDKGEATMMMMMSIQIDTICEQLTVLLRREVRYRPAAKATTKPAGASAADLERQGSSRTVVQGSETHDRRTALCNWAFHVVNNFSIPTDAVNVAMNLFDRYSAARFKHASNQVSKTATERNAGDGLPLLMVASLYLAVKLKLNIKNPLHSIAFASLSGGQFTALELEAMEAKLLRVLDWLVHPPTSHECVHEYITLLTLVHEQEQWQQQQQQKQSHFNPRRRRGVDSRGGSYIAPVSGPIQFHYGMFSNGAYGYRKRTPTYREVMESVWGKACQILDMTVADYGFVRFKPSTVACAALYYAMQHQYDEGYFYHIYHHHPFPSPLEELHRLGVMVNAEESSMCLESIYLLFEAPATPAQEPQQSKKKNRSKKEGNTTKRTTSPQNIMDQLDAVDDP